MDGEDVLATSFGGSRVYRLEPGGRVTLVAGRGLVGDDDGAGRDARFHNPNGIALAPDGRTLYVAEIRPGADGPFSRGRMRAILLGGR
jgi:sugar lactone lactonase YvrE